MTREVSADVIIDMPRAQAWETLSDISLAHHYVPGIVRTEIVSEQAMGVGASRYVYRNAKSYIQETVEEWRDGEGPDAEPNGVEREWSDRIHRLLLGDEAESPDRRGQQHEKVRSERSQAHLGRR